MAIVLPLLLLILFGIIDFGLMLNRQIVLTEAAREAARAVALHPEADPSATVAAVFADLRIDPSSVQITPCPADLTGSDAPVSTVELHYSYETKTPIGSMMLIFGSGVGDIFDLQAKGAMACAG
jgi:hypothetical protein